MTTNADRRAQYAQDTLQRRAAAEQRADLLIRRSAPRRSASRTALGDVARGVAEALNLERCDLLILQSADRALLIQVRRPPAESGALDANVEFREVRVPPTASPAAMLPGDGPVNRVHVFFHHPQSLQTLGVLSIAARGERQLTTEDRAFANAVGDRLAAAIARGDFRGVR